MLKKFIAGLVGFMIFVRQARLIIFSVFQWVRRGFSRGNIKAKVKEEAPAEDLK